MTYAGEGRREDPEHHSSDVRHWPGVICGRREERPGGVPVRVRWGGGGGGAGPALQPGKLRGLSDVQ